MVTPKKKDIQDFESELMLKYKPNSKAGEHLIKAIKFAKAKLYQSASVEFSQAAQLNKQEILPIARQIFEEKVVEDDYDFALSVGMLLLSLDKTDFQLSAKLAGFARKAGNPNQAIALFRQSLQIQPNYIVAICGLGATLENVPYYDSMAVNSFRSMVDLTWAIPDCIIDNPGDRIKFEANYDKELAKEAVIFLKDQQQLNINNSEKVEIEVKPTTVNENSKKSLENENPKKPLERVYKSESITPHDIIRYLEHFLTDDSKNKNIVEYNIIVLKLQKDVDVLGAKDSFSKLLSKLEAEGTSLPYIDVISGIILIKTGYMEAARDHFLELLKINKHNRYAAVNLGLIYQKLGNIYQAARYLIWGHYLLSRSNRAYQIETHINYAHDKYAARSFKEARVALELIIGENYASVNDYLAYFDCLEHEGLFDKLLEDLEKAKTIFPDEPEISIYIAKQIDNISAKATNWIKEGRKPAAKQILIISLRLEERIDTIRQILNLIGAEDLSDAEAAERQAYKDRLSFLLKKHKEVDEAVLARQQKMAVLREDYLKKAKLAITEGKYKIATSMVENAYRMKNDQETFNILSKLYKMQNRDSDLVYLEGEFSKNKTKDNQITK